MLPEGFAPCRESGAPIGSLPPGSSEWMFQSILVKARSLDSSKRYRSAAEMRNDIQLALTQYENEVAASTAQTRLDNPSSSEN